MVTGVFYAFGTLVGEVAGPVVFGALIGTGARGQLMWGYVLGGMPMLGAAVVEAWLGADAAGQSLEKVAPPLSAS